MVPIRSIAVFVSLVPCYWVYWAPSDVCGQKLPAMPAARILSESLCTSPVSVTAALATPQRWHPNYLRYLASRLCMPRTMNSAPNTEGKMKKTVATVLGLVVLLFILTAVRMATRTRRQRPR